MIHIAVRVRDLASSNIDTLVSKSNSPAKALGLLRTQIEESVIELSDDLTKAKRQLERADAHSEKLADQAKEWTAKAKVAMDHGREDLARSALLAREDDEAKAKAAKTDAEELGANIEELESVIVALETKRKAVIEQIAQHKPSASAATPDAAPVKDSKADQRMDRIDALERRVAMQTEGTDEAAESPADIDAEIASLARDSKIEAELAAMKKPAVKRARKKAK